MNGVKAGSLDTLSSVGPYIIYSDICNSNPPPCNNELISGSSPGTVNPQPQITGVSPSPLTYGGGGALTISGTNFNSLIGTLTIHFDDAAITATGSVSSNILITGTYQVNCGATVGAHNIWLSAASSDGGQASSDPFPVTVSLPGAPTPTISFNGTAVNGTQSVVVGQQIALSASVSLPPCMSISSQQWSTPPGDAIAGYTNNGTPTGGPPDTTGGQVADTADLSTNAPSYNFYWVYPSDGAVNMTYQYTMSGGGGSVSSPVATATFNVTGPSGGTMTNTHDTKLNINTLTSNGTSSPYLVYGNLSGSLSNPTCNPCGMLFTASGYSNASNGSYSFVQLITTDDITGSYTCTSQAGIDSSYPYGNIAPTQTADSPPLRLDPTDRTLTRSFNATMYLMWKSNTAGSIPVPLGYQIWAFSGSANCSASCGSASNWKATTSGTPGPAGGFVSSTASQADYGYPTWSQDASGCD